MSLVFKDIQVKTTMRKHYTSTIMTKMTKKCLKDRTKSWCGCEATGILLCCRWMCELGQPVCKTGHFLWWTYVDQMTRSLYSLVITQEKYKCVHAKHDCERSHLNSQWSNVRNVTNIHPQVDDQRMAYLYIGMPLSNKNEQTSDIVNDVNESQNHYAKEMIQVQKTIYCLIPCT